MAEVLVTGGTGTLGRHVVNGLREAGADVRVLTRTAHPQAHEVTGDLGTGAGLADAVRGANTVVHCATHPRHRHVDIPGTERLLNLAGAHGVQHFVYISIVGIDNNPFNYYRSKLRIEEMIAASGVPYTVLRATQFHDLIFGVVSGLAKLPLSPVPKGFRSQPIDVEAVATRLVELAMGTPVGRARDIGGPRVDALDDLLRVYCAAVGKSRMVLPVGLPGRAAKAFRAGENLLGPAGETLGGTFDDYLARRFPR